MYYSPDPRNVMTANIVKLKIEFGGCCSICGYNKNYAALQFHHVNPKDKLIGISAAIPKGIDVAREEAMKCILVCSNCHVELHHKRLQKEVWDNTDHPTVKLHKGPIHKCLSVICEHKWRPEANKPVVCPKCGSNEWKNYRETRERRTLPFSDDYMKRLNRLIAFDPHGVIQDDEWLSIKNEPRQYEMVRHVSTQGKRYANQQPTGATP